MIWHVNAFFVSNLKVAHEFSPSLELLNLKGKGQKFEGNSFVELDYTMSAY